MATVEGAEWWPQLGSVLFELLWPPGSLRLIDIPGQVLVAIHVGDPTTKRYIVLRSNKAR